MVSEPDTGRLLKNTYLADTRPGQAASILEAALKEQPERTSRNG